MRKEDMIFSTFVSVLLFPVIPSYFINEVVDSNAFQVKVSNLGDSLPNPISDLKVIVFDENVNLIEPSTFTKLGEWRRPMRPINLPGPFNILFVVTSHGK